MGHKYSECNSFLSLGLEQVSFCCELLKSSACCMLDAVHWTTAGYLHRGSLALLEEESCHIPSSLQHLWFHPFVQSILVSGFFIWFLLHNTSLALERIQCLSSFFIFLRVRGWPSPPPFPFLDQCKHSQAYRFFSLICVELVWFVTAQVPC